MIAGELPCVDAADVRQFERHEPQVIELARRAEQHAALVRRPAFRRVRCPRCVAQRDIERRRIRGLVLLPARHRFREPELGERRAKRLLQPLPERSDRRTRPPRRPGACSSPCAGRTVA